MDILNKNDIVVEVDKKIVFSFNKKYKDFIDVNGNHCLLDLKTVKKRITAYLEHNRQNFEGKKVFSFIYDYDSNIAVIMMKRTPNFEVYDITFFS